MRRWFETRGYIFCNQLAVWRVCNRWPVAWLENIWTGIWYRYYCPRPCIDNWTARACVEGGHCGCENQKFYPVVAPAHSRTATGDAT